MACCFKLAESVTTEVLKSCIVDRVNRVYSLIKNYGSNLNQLQDIHLQLRAKKDDNVGKVENGESKLEQVTNEARDWFQRIAKLLEDEQVKNLMNEDYIRAKDQCCFGLILCNLYQRYGISRFAKAKADEMQGKLTHRPQDPVTVPTWTLDLEPMNTRHCKGLKTREEAEQRILEMLKDDQVYALGICGMGGIEPGCFGKMASNNAFQLQLPKLNGKNYDNWSVQLKVFFRSQDLWNLVETGFKDVTDSAAFESLKTEEKDLLMETRKKDQKALYAIFQAVEESIFQKVSMAETSHEAWDILQKSY